MPVDRDELRKVIAVVRVLSVALGRASAQEFRKGLPNGDPHEVVTLEEAAALLIKVERMLAGLF